MYVYCYRWKSVCNWNRSFNYAPVSPHLAITHTHIILIGGRDCYTQLTTRSGFQSRFVSFILEEEGITMKISFHIENYSAAKIAVCSRIYIFPPVAEHRAVSRFHCFAIVSYFGKCEQNEQVLKRHGSLTHTETGEYKFLSTDLTTRYTLP